MKKVRKFASLLLALAMVLSLNITALADDPVTGTITITNATIGQSYHIFKLFDATVSTEGVTYIATAAQKEALEDVEGNVFAFTETSDENYYYVTIGAYDDGNGGQLTYSDDEVIAFIRAYVLKLSGSLIMCNFPGAEEESAGDTDTIDETDVIVTVDGLDDNGLATQSTVTFYGLPLGYYFITSSLGTVVSLDTTRTSAEIVDKNDGEPTWDNDPADPDDPVKSVLDEDGRDIDGEEVSIDETLTYMISYTNQSGKDLTDVILTDTIPKGSTYSPDTIAISFLDDNGDEVDKSDYNGLGITNVVLNDSSDTLSWSFDTLPAGYTLIATFNVTVDNTTTSITIVNDADLSVKLGDNTYSLTTNEVKNPVNPEPAPKKDVSVDDTTGTGGNGETVKEGDILTYQITYTNDDDDPVKVVIEDMPPTGTVYVADSAGGTIQLESKNTTTDITEDDANSIVIDADGTITWTIESLESGATVRVFFQVKVTEAAITIIDNEITNTSSGTIGNNEFKTNTVKNPTGDDPGPSDNGKVIINADGSKSTVSTGSYGDTVTFDVSIDAVNTVASSDTSSTATTTQVTAYYIYDLLGAGFDLDDITKATLTIGSNGYKIVYDSTETGKTSSGALCYSIQDDSGNEVGTLFTYKNGTSTQDDTSDDTTLIAVKIPWVDDSGSALYGNVEIHLIYTATINTEAEIAGNGNENKAIFDYSTAEDDAPEEPDPDYPDYGNDKNHESEEVTTTTYTYALDIQKISKESGVALEGAKFTAVDAGGNTIYAVPVDGSDGVYEYTSDSNTMGATSTFTTNSNGQIIIKGVDIGTYSFTETQAPAGYTLLKGSTSVTAEMSGSSTTTTTTSKSTTRYFAEITSSEEWNSVDVVYTKDEKGNFVLQSVKPDDYTSGYYKLVSTSSEGTSGSLVVNNTFEVAVTAIYVENSSDSLLPSTGGIGTTIFYIVGGLLVFGAAVVLITRRRMNAR